MNIEMRVENTMEMIAKRVACFKVIVYFLLIKISVSSSICFSKYRSFFKKNEFVL